MRLLAVTFAAAAAVVVAAGGGNDGARPAAATLGTPQEVLVRLAGGASPARWGAASYNEVLDVWRVPVPSSSSLKEMLASLSSDPRVASVQPNYRYQRAARPNDPLYSERQAPSLQAINAPAGWEIETGSRDVVIAIIDGGVDIAHPELSDRIWTNGNEIPGNGIDDDKNKCVDDIHGCNLMALPGNGDVADRDGHGTFVAGLAAAKTNNGAGTAGVAWDATIMPVRMLDPSGFGETEHLAEAILYAANNGARVINMSLALIPTGSRCPDDPLVEDALRVAREEKGATLLAAAGNGGVGCVGFPASSEHTIAVGAAGPAENPDGRAFFSQWGPEIDVVAPGQDVTSTCPENPAVPTGFCHGPAYGTSSGTSFSTPLVSGLAALLISQDPSRTPAEIRERIRATARDLPDGLQPNWDGTGMIDVGAALGAQAVSAFVDFRARDVSAVGLRLVVGDPAAPLCEALLWERHAIEATAVSGTFGASECGAYWPPAPDRPWNLEGMTAGRKSERLAGFSLRSGLDSCPATGLPARIIARATVIASIRCDNAGIVANDLAVAAALIPKIPHRFEQDVRYAGSVGDPPLRCADFYGSSVWFRLPAGAGPSRFVVIDTFGSGFDTVLGVFRDAGGGNLEQVTCNDDYNDASRVVWERDGTSDYLVVAAAYETAPPGRLVVNVSPGMPPRNDAIERADAFNEPVLQAAHHATVAASDPEITCATRYGYSVWFTFSTPGGETAITTGGSNYDTVLAVFRAGPGGALTEVACNQDADLIRKTSLVVWNAAPGDYIVLVGAFRDHASGVLRMSFTSPPRP